MPETFELGKKYQVVKAWSREPVPGITTWRFSVEVGELLRFIGPNWDGAYFRDAQGKTIVLPAKVAFRIMGNLTQRAPDLAKRERPNDCEIDPETLPGRYADDPQSR